MWTRHDAQVTNCQTYCKCISAWPSVVPDIVNHLAQTTGCMVAYTEPVLRKQKGLQTVARCSMRRAFRQVVSSVQLTHLVCNFSAVCAMQQRARPQQSRLHTLVCMRVEVPWRSMHTHHISAVP